MNFLLVLLLLLSLGGSVFARRPGWWGELALAWTVTGLVATALLAPSLVIPDGVPSPAASLGRDAPWVGEAHGGLDPAAGNPALRDVTYQIQPWLIFLQRELRAGHLPFWNPHQFAGMPFWGNGQSAPLFPLHLLFVVLPLGVGLVLIPWLRIVVAGCGAFALARELGLSRRASLVAAVIFPLSGMLVSFLLYPMGNALCLVPWVLLAVERIANGKGTWIGLACAAGLQLLAGHPETALHTALLTGVFLLVRGGRPWWRVWANYVGGFVAAAGLAAVVLLPFVASLEVASRWLRPPPVGDAALGLLLLQPLRLVLPQLYGNPAVGTWWGPFNYLATAVYASAAAIPLAAGGLVLARRSRSWAAVAVMTLFSFLGAYHLPGVADLLGALPVLERALHHRLIFGLELGLALLAAAGCQRWLTGKGRGLLGGVAVVFGLLALAWWRFLGDWQSQGLVADSQRWTAWAVAAAGLLALGLLLHPRARSRFWPVLLVAIAADLVVAHGAFNPGLSLERLFPVTGSVAAAQGKEGRVAGFGRALHPNAAMVYGLYDIRGDDPMKLDGYERLYGQRLGQGHPTAFRPVTRWDSPWLDQLSVRWVLTPPGASAKSVGWRLVYDGEDGRLFERPSALPMVRLSGGNTQSLQSDTPLVTHRSPGRWRIEWLSSVPARVVVAEAWERGWRGRAGGEPIPVTRSADGLLQLDLNAGSATVSLDYWPRGLRLGAWVSSVTLLLLLASDWLNRRSRRLAAGS